MKKRILYFLPMWKVLVVQIFIAATLFQLSFAMYDTINAALDLEWTLFGERARVMIMYAVLLLPLQALGAYARSHVIKTIMVRMKRDYLRGVFAKNINEFQRENNAKYISALTNDFTLIEKDAVEQAILIIQSIVMFTMGIAIIVIISPIVLLFGVGIFVMNIFVSLLSSKPVNKHNKERSEMMGRYSGFIKEVLSAFHIIKTNDLEKRIEENYREQSVAVQEKKYVIDKIMSYIFALQNMNFSLTFLVMMFIVSYMTIQGQIAIAGVVVVVYNLENVVNPIALISEAMPRVLSVKTINRRIDESLKNQSTHVETEAFDGLEKGIGFHDVSFGYDDTLVLEDVNVEFEKGGKYLVIGPSGGGKSTLLRLLRKYFNPNDGVITLDEKDLKDVKKLDYFGKIANIEQKIFLFEDSLRNNLTLYKDYSEEELQQAIERAGLSKFVKSRQGGLDTLIQDNGKNISGGEKSRIAIARGLLNNAEIIFLDEAFASLDRDSAKAIESDLLKLKGVTLINVSHVVIEENKEQYDDIILVRNKHVKSSKLKLVAVTN